MMLPVDLASITYSQRQLDAYFSEESARKRLVIVQRHGKERLKLREAGDLSPVDTAMAYLWGAGPAGFRAVMQFCADRCLFHKDLKLMIQTYNEQHGGEKRVDEAVQKILGKPCCSHLVRAVETQNVEVLEALREMSWQEARIAFIDEEDADKGLLLKVCCPDMLNVTVADFIVEFITNKAPEADRRIIFGAKDQKNRSVSFLLALNSTHLSSRLIDLMMYGINDQDFDGKTALMTLFEEQYSALDLKSLLKFAPDLSIKDRKEQNVLFYSYEGIARLQRSQKNVLLVKYIQQLSPELQVALLLPFFSHRNEQGLSVYQKLNADNKFDQAMLVMEMNKTFKWEDAGWVENIKED